MAKRTSATALEPLAPLPTFPLEEQTPAVKVLLALLEHERTQRLEMRAQVRALEAEVRRLKDSRFGPTLNRAPWTRAPMTMTHPRAGAQPRSDDVPARRNVASV